MLQFRPVTSIEQACACLGLSPDAPPGELQGAFQRAMAQARGCEEHVPPARFREILDAYRVLRKREYTDVPSERRFDTWPSIIELTPEEAILGGMKVGRLPTGRPFETRLPPGLRHNDVIWVWGWLLQVRIDESEELAVSGDDIWVTVHRARESLQPGMRMALDLPTGPFSFRLSAEAIAAGLARAPGFGLPARKSHRQGDLYIRMMLEDRRLNAGEFLKKLTKAA
jgi:curved DNA-binding protein